MKDKKIPQTTLFIFLLFLVLIGGAVGVYLLINKPAVNKRVVPEETMIEKTIKTQAGDFFITTLVSEGTDIAIQVALPKEPRYEDGAPVVVYVPTFFTPKAMDFSEFKDFTELGAIEIIFLYPGRVDKSGAKSGGTNDYGGEQSIKALRDVINFAAGEKTNKDGLKLDALSEIKPLFENVGLYAFSHPGIAATNVLAFYGNELPDNLWFVGRENPTMDLLSSLEIGHYAENSKTKIFNSLYKYPDFYSSTDIQLDYSSLKYDEKEAVPYFDLNGNNQSDSNDYVLGSQVPTMFGKRFYSTKLLTALRDNHALSSSSWPEDLAAPEEAEEVWPFRETVNNYSKLEKTSPDLRVMLVFSDNDHVQTAVDKPHLHQAYDGFTAAGLWIRLNPDAVYIESFDPKAVSRAVEHPANTEPANWLEISDWAYPAKTASHLPVSMAAVAEMADRTRDNNWANDLSKTLYEN